MPQIYLQSPNPSKFRRWQRMASYSRGNQRSLRHIWRSPYVCPALSSAIYVARWSFNPRPAVNQSSAEICSLFASSRRVVSGCFLINFSELPSTNASHRRSWLKSVSILLPVASPLPWTSSPRHASPWSFPSLSPLEDYSNLGHFENKTQVEYYIT